MPDTVASSGVTDHAFRATPWWGLCSDCGLSQAAHRILLATTFARMVNEQETLPRRCEECVQLDRATVDLATGETAINHFKCTHGGQDA